MHLGQKTFFRSLSLPIPSLITALPPLDVQLRAFKGRAVMLHDIGRGKGIISWLAQAHYFGQRARRPPPKGNRFTVDLSPVPNHIIALLEIVCGGGSASFWPGEGIKPNGQSLL